MIYICTHCGVREKDQIYFECPICGKLSLREKEGKWFCREHGEVELAEIILICKSCGKPEVQTEQPEELVAEQGKETTSVVE